MKRLLIHRRSLLALLAALTVGVYVYIWLGSLAATVPVIVAAADIPAHSRIERGLVRLAQVPVVAVHPGGTDSLTDVLGKYALVALHEGEQVLLARLSADGRPPGPLPPLSPEQVAVFVPVSVAGGVGGVVRPGDRVDVLFVARRSRTEETVCRNLIPGLSVLAVRSESGDVLTDDRRHGAIGGVVVAATPAQAELIALGSEAGVFYLAVSGYGTATLPGPGVDSNSLFVAPPAAGDAAPAEDVAGVEP